MKKSIYFFFAFLMACSFSNAQQTTAMDFTMDDCNGNMHNLFTTLDSNEVVVMEYFMTCSSCIDAGHKIESMLVPLHAQFPGKINWYQFAYVNSYDCITVNDFVTTNGFTSVAFDSGEFMVAYYGGFGMPTVVVVAGPNHDVLFTDIGFSTGDTTIMANAIRTFYGVGNAVSSIHENENSFSVFPNPANDEINIQLALSQNSLVQMQLIDLAGRVVAEIYNASSTEKILQQQFTVADLSNGTYLLKAMVNGQTSFHKINVLK